MPFYEYECQACKYYTEVMQKVSDTPLSKCPSCGKRALKKLVSAPVFRLKGSGWYETDFKSDKENKRNLVGAEKEEPKAESKSDTKDTKDTKTDAKETKDIKETKDSKPAEPKSAERAGAGRSSVAVSRKARPPAVRRPARKSKSARKSRR
jgi:putative FmdB family regulatory protein